MKKRIAVILIIASALFGQMRCSQSSGSGQSTEKQPEEKQSEAKPSIPIFQLSPAPPPSTPQSDWCRIQGGENVLINAERVNTNRRYFYLPQGITMLSVGYPTLAATLFLKPLSNGNVEVFTGANFPTCLSRPSYLSPAGGSAQMRYNNQQDIEFSLELQVENNYPKITIEQGIKYNYGMSVVHCLECQ
ncbi:MAG: hypothetical protein H6574_05660 [Lewinellaceae bacterium]|nr:hypothetical protein [Saprospiraceae bacterium]MCB9330549.1 hypothetical protein [Lewinellaceae bacterium]